MSALACEGLTVGYGDGAPVIDGLDLGIAEGAVVALLGANGAGKTTLLRALAGLEPVRTGRIRLGGRELTALSTEDRVRSGLALVPEGRSVVVELTVDENLHLGGLWRHKPKARKAAVEEMYALFPPLDRRRRAAGHTLSGGERQMLALARALLARPEVLLLDEPSLGLAPKATAQLLGVLRETAARTGLTVLLAEQNVTGALSVAQRGVVLSLGTVVADRPAAELAADPALRHAYLGF
ncbi:ABC transporter ATP-binding protein [Glycomyces algeriensis]|uniref:ABC transporter ATP-binding protein n=1 Tax=Glycomyces algeriensis TaxID=256037 RepID=A0A9W6G9V7_9ACTN|nr:ABC transporter ATP-binding protein [Glycomyces algeriensis]MDA1365582.1 ABC transporter ATP-binding protein [Glycomyces algeriensis]MDR7351270.1 branched-chain amino acid transport system ATP-binding protein [Glycomyces algeriensis]GLI43985.1 ABC transporter ATP-binding protein [Glycomyces algeriensis]